MLYRRMVLTIIRCCYHSNIYQKPFLPPSLYLTTHKSCPPQVPLVASYLPGSVGGAGVVAASSDGLLLELVASDDDDVVSLSGVTSGAISRSASAMKE